MTSAANAKLIADFDLQGKIDKVREDFGLEKSDPHQGNAKKGSGWKDAFYNYYCEFCNYEIQEPFIADNDLKRTKKCVECKQSNQLFTREERIEHLYERMANLRIEESNLKKRKKLWKKFRKNHPFSEVIPYAMKSDEEDMIVDEEDVKHQSSPDVQLLPYKENQMWESKIDLDDYVDNDYYIPHDNTEITDRAWTLRNKYGICKKQMDIAVENKQLGNKHLKNGEYDKALDSYTLSILARTDYKDAYNNRSLVYLKLKKYEECIADCTMVIAMIDMVDVHLKKSHAQFKAYFRRAKANRMIESLADARADIDMALNIRPNDSGAQTLLQEIKMFAKRERVRNKMQLQMVKNADSVQDFDEIFQISIEFLEIATSNVTFNFETGHSDQLLNRLLIFLSQNKNYCVRFADQNGIYLCLKYLKQKFKIIGKWKEKMKILEKPFLLLNYCCEKDVNFSELRKKKFRKLIPTVVLYTFQYYSQMPKDLQKDSMRFASVCTSIPHVQEFIAESLSAKLISHFCKFQANTNADEQHLTGIRCLFQCFSYLSKYRLFAEELCKRSSPFVYELLLNSFYKYHKKCEEYRIKMDKNDTWTVDRESLRQYEQMQFTLAIILDLLAMMFDSTADVNDDDTQHDDDHKVSSINYKEIIVDAFLRHSKVEQHIRVLVRYTRHTFDFFLKYHEQIMSIYSSNSSSKKTKEDVEKHCMRYFAQFGKCFNIFVTLAKNLKTHDLLLGKHCIPMSRLLFQLIPIVRKYNTYPIAKMRNMLKAVKHEMLSYFDHLSCNSLFDNYMIAHLFTVEERSKMDILCQQKWNESELIKIDGRHSKLFLPLFLEWMCEVFTEEYKERQHIKLMNEFAHYKSCAIRLLYRWLQRRSVEGNKKWTVYDHKMYGNLMVDHIIYKYHESFIEWINFNDLQVIANTPLILKQIVIYTQEFNDLQRRKKKKKLKKNMLKKTVIKHWNAARLKQLMFLTKSAHNVIQFNACLCMDQIQLFDESLAVIVSAIGAKFIVDRFTKVQEEQNAQKMRAQNMALTAPVECLQEKE